MNFFKKEIVSNRLYLPNGEPAPFAELKGDVGVLATDDEWMITELRRCISLKRYGVVEIDAGAWQLAWNRNGGPILTQPIPAPPDRKPNVAPSINAGATFCHSGDLGDIIYALPTIKYLGGGTLYIRADSFTRQRLTPDRWACIKDLLLAQRYIHGVEEWKGQICRHNLNDFRMAMRDEMRAKRFDIYKSLAVRHCQAHVVPVEIVEKSWLSVPGIDKVADVVFARSNRYRGHDFPWGQAYALYGRCAVFIGLKEEHWDFCRRVGNVPWQPTSTLLEAARIIAGAKLFVGNQSSLYAIAEGLKQNAILEVWPQGPNCLFKRKNVWQVWHLDAELPKLDQLQ